MERVRRVAIDDLGPVTRMLSGVRRRTLRASAEEIARICTGGHGALLADGGTLLGLLLVTPPHAGTAWMRALALADGVQAGGIMTALVGSVCDTTGTCELRYSADGVGAGWLVPSLSNAGFAHETDIVGYEKRRLDIPASGDQTIQLRPATAADTALIVDFDRRCFAPEWQKDDVTVRQSFAETASVVIAMRGDTPVGYTLTTSHFDSQLQHLVRIAVLPDQQGRGTGVRLLADVVQRARAQQAHSLTLNTQAYNQRAQRLYEWFGFRTTGERQRVWRFTGGAAIG